MKKTLLSLVVLLLCGAMFASCAPQSVAVEVEVEATPSAEPQAVTQTVISATDQPQQAQVPDEETAKKLDAMLPMLDSILRTMGVEGEMQYAPRDPAFFWSVLYLMGENWGEVHPLVKKDGDEVVVPRQVMQEFAAAAFLDYDDLLEVPENFAESLRYDEGMDAYSLAPSDMDELEGKMDSALVLADGRIQVVAGLYDLEGQELGAVAFVLSANPYASGISDPIFYYSVENAEFMMN